MAQITLLSQTTVLTILNASAEAENSKIAAAASADAAEQSAVDTGADKIAAEAAADRAEQYAAFSLVSDYGFLDGESATTFDMGNL